MKGTERELEEKFRNAVRRAGGRAYKFISPGNTGVPDRLVVLPGGRCGFVELKRPGERPRADQRLQIGRLTELGCVAAVIDRESQIPGVLAAIRREQEDRREEDGI